MTHTGQDALAEVLQALRGVEGGADPQAAAAAIWPAFREAVGLAMAENRAAEIEGVQRWQQERHRAG